MWKAAAACLRIDYGKDLAEKQILEKLVPRIAGRFAAKIGVRAAEKWGRAIDSSASSAIGGALNFSFGEVGAAACIEIPREASSGEGCRRTSPQVYPPMAGLSSNKAAAPALGAVRFRSIGRPIMARLETKSKREWCDAKVPGTASLFGCALALVLVPERARFAIASRPDSPQSGSRRSVPAFHARAHRATFPRP